MEKTLATGSLGSLAVVLITGGCTAGGNAEPPAEWSSFEQALELEIEGVTVPLPLEGLDLWLTEDARWPERFEIKGAGTSLGGTFPADVRVGYEDDWTVLVGHSIPILARHSTPYEDRSSVVTLPGVGAVEVVGGRFTIESVAADWDAQTPLTGRIELRIRRGTGETTLRGRLAVKGTGWG